MGISGLHADAFYREVGADASVWTVEDEGGVPAPRGSDGRRAMPFWSRRSRVERVIAAVPAFAQFRPREVSREAFVEHWLPGPATDGLLVGLNWSGERATGFDYTPAEVLERLAHSEGGGCSTSANSSGRKGYRFGSSATAVIWVRR